ncbi:DUF503 domain-containing protein [Longimicrobium terrae]|uniref:DUF503 domain-containing protein n=1 Tax=Longimicrobium terrae TaxID=1639882 RepID=A0A841H856_9BACT|nr:DUF503 domain-containing protein [Longimicrobium terrae]MBB4637889.1 hypothetical protein [Longimicrobium terrae]MBB6074016.1 hypothetical protein [Longimicrobium terrae]NNC31177.1 DUF503 domain-containing protein [Longimicrobium terrae]
MVVGVVVWELHIPGCASLKDKRAVVKSLKDRLHARFNVSAAETAHQDLLQRAELSVAVVATDRRQAQSVLSSADGMVEGRARIIDSYTTFY